MSSPLNITVSKSLYQTTSKGPTHLALYDPLFLYLTNTKLPYLVLQTDSFDHTHGRLNHLKTSSCNLFICTPRSCGPRLHPHTIKLNALLIHLKLIAPNYSLHGAATRDIRPHVTVHATWYLHGTHPWAASTYILSQEFQSKFYSSARQCNL